MTSSTDKIELYKIHREILDIAGQYHTEPVGITFYEGSTKADKNYPRQLNTIIILLIKIFDRLEKLENKSINIETNKIIESLEGKFNNLTINPGVDKLIVPPKKWLYY